MLLIMNKIIAIVGMCGSGKTIVSDYLKNKGWKSLRFGQIVLDEVKRRNLPPSEQLEREIRENLRKEHGMGAFATLNLPKIEELAKSGDTALDGLYSWTEYKILKKKFPQLAVIAVYAAPKTRYDRISKRKSINDPELKNRSFTVEEAKARDAAEIEKIEKAGPIAMADFTIVNEGTSEETIKQLENILQKI